MSSRAVIGRSPRSALVVIVIAGAAMTVRAIPKGATCSALDDFLASYSDGRSSSSFAIVAVLLGLRHATDPDDLAAVTTLIASTERRAPRRGQARPGVGAGHARDALRSRRADRPLPRLSARARSARRRNRDRIPDRRPGRLAPHSLAGGAFHAHAHDHGERSHAHLHSHPSAPHEHARADAPRRVRGRSPARNRRQRRRRHPAREHDRPDRARCGRSASWPRSLPSR